MRGAGVLDFIGGLLGKILHSLGLTMFWATATAASLLVLGLPAAWSGPIPLEEMRRQGGLIAGWVAVIGLSFLIVQAFAWAWGRAVQVRSAHLESTREIRILRRLTDDEKAVLRPFVEDLRQTQVLRLNRVVRDLMEKGVLSKTTKSAGGSFHDPTNFGGFRHVSIQGWAWEYFLERPELAGLPPRPQEPENLTEGD
jgi:hypothetical protein